MINTPTNIKTIDNKKISKTKINLRKLFVSPYGATIFPIFVLLVAFLLPPTLYEYYVNEPDYIFLNFPVVFYVSICLFFYYCGIFISNFKLVYKMNLFNKIKVSPFMYFGIISFLTIVLQVIFIVVFNLYLRNTFGISLFIVPFTGAGELIKVYSLELNIPLGLGAIPTFIIGFEFWLLYHLYKLSNTDYNYHKEFKYLKLSILISVFLFISENILTVSRPALIVFVLGWVMIYTYFNKGRLFFRLIKLSLIIIIIFAITSILRWSSTREDFLNLILGRLIGYTIAPYNRLALIIIGRLNYNLPKLFYLFPIHKIPLTEMVINPSFSELNFLYAYRALASAHLNTSYNMSTLFGSMYESLGIASPIYFAVLGIIGNRLFHSFKGGRTFGVVLYPLFYASVALWIVDVNYFIMMFFYFFYAFLFLVIYNIILKPKDYLK
jgi:hypothetical protein